MQTQQGYTIVWSADYKGQMGSRASDKGVSVQLVVELVSSPTAQSQAASSMTAGGLRVTVWAVQCSTESWSMSRCQGEAVPQGHLLHRMLISQCQLVVCLRLDVCVSVPF